MNNKASAAYARFQIGPYAQLYFTIQNGSKK